MEVLKGTRFWPPHTFWKDKVLFMEATEQMTSLTRLKQIMRNYGTMEVFENISALLFGRWRGYTSQQRREVERIIMRTVTEEFGRSDLPIIMNMDFGHTDPQMILPLGVRAEVDPTGPTLTLKESPLI
jgi:muramoyltetrapeptide carboxypeptidase LdcA involved in peptidoglycan recycling